MSMSFNGMQNKRRSFHDVRLERGADEKSTFRLAMVTLLGDWEEYMIKQLEQSCPDYF